MTGFEHSPPASEAEFQEFMEALDRHFAERGMQVHARPLAAIAEIGHATGERFAVPQPREPRDGSYSGPDLVLRALTWYEERYGERLKVYYGDGHGLVVIRGDIWGIEYPAITGRVGFLAGDSPDSPSIIYGSDGKHRQVEPSSPEWLDPHLIKIDVLDYVQDLAVGLRTSLSRSERRGILALFCEHRLYLHALIVARRYRYVEEARADLESAVERILHRPPASGPAKWACMHAVEKVFKSLLDAAGRNYPTRGKGHDLRHLYELVREATGLVLSEELIDEVQCTAAVRYDSKLVSVRESVRAHMAALRLAASAALVMREMYPAPEA